MLWFVFGAKWYGKEFFNINKKLFLLDMDGTIYLDNRLFEGTMDFLRYIKAHGGKYLFLTNNSSKSVEAYIKKLSGLGIESVEDDFLTSTNATVVYLLKKKYKKIYAFGTRSFKEQLQKADLPVCDELSDDIDCLCMGFDTELQFRKLEDACILLNRGADYIATNPDLVCPTWYGSVPDCGSVSQMLFNATKRKPIVIGKPNPDMVNLALSKTGFQKKDAVIIGDRLYTDIACGVNSGIDSVLVLSGETALSDVKTSEVKPTYIFNTITDVLKALRENHN